MYEKTLLARLTSDIGWLDLDLRKLSVPPAALLAALRSLPRTDPFETLQSRIR